MKKTLSFFAIILTTVLFSQELKYEEVVKMDSTITKDELFNRARTWVTKNYKSEKDAIIVNDSNTGEITGNGTIRYDPEILYWGSKCARGYISYKINIYVKEDRYKYEINTFSHEGTPCGNGISGLITSYGLITENKKPENGAKAGWDEIKDLIKLKMPKTIESLKQGMSKKYEGNNNW